MARRLPKTISEKEFLEGMTKVRKPHIKAAFMLAFYQCMRISEITCLKKENIDLSRGFLHIELAKGKKDRDVPIMQPVRKYLKHIPIKIGIRALEKQANKYYPSIYFHCLRHSGASFYLNDKQIDIRYVQLLLGHSRLDTTQIYTHVSPFHLKNRFDNIW